MEYQRRVIDGLLDEALQDLSAIAIEGAKGVGKTATASRYAKTILSLNEPRTRDAVSANCDLLGELESPTFIDEWQLEPQVWERVRQYVDSAPARGRFLLAGSAGLEPGTRIHTGAGRILRLMMRPMTLSERGVAEPTVSMRDLFQGNATLSGDSPFGVRDYAVEILRSGFPGIRDIPDRNRGRQLDAYVARIVDRELPDNGVAVRRPATLLAWLRAYAAATATNADHTKILNAATPADANKPSRPTVEGYREHLQRIFVLDPLEAWLPVFNPLKRLTLSPKHHLVDPALAARLVGVGLDGLLVGQGQRVSATTGTWLGALFESLAIQSVRVYADAMNATIGHLRTKSGDREIDAIVEADDMSCLAIEVKLSDTVTDQDVKHLLWLRDQLGERVRDLVVLNTGRFAYRRRDGVAVVPLALMCE